MSRNFYSYAIFFCGLAAAIAFFQSIIFLQLGTQVYSVESFPAWYVCSFIASLIATLFVLKYFHYKGYVLAFWSALIITLAQLVQTSVVYGLLLGHRGLSVYYLPVIVVVLVLAIVYSVCLTFSRSGEKPWLKASGIFGFILGVTLVSTILWSMSGEPDILKNATVEKIHQWTSLLGSFVPLLFAINFLDEKRIVKKLETSGNQHRSFEAIMPIVCVLTFVCVVFFGGAFTRDSTGQLAWEGQLAVKAKEWEKQFESRTFVGTRGDTLKYQLLKPTYANIEEKYPLVVCLPFGGGVEGCPPAEFLSSDANQRKYPSFLFVPYCPQGAGWGGVPNYPTIDTLVFEAITSLEKEFAEINEKKCYVTGVSRGGYGSWHFITKRPDMFAAAMPVCGEGNPTLASNIVDVGVWAFHGKKDRNVPVSGSREMIAAIKNAGGDPKYTEFPDAGHNVWELVKGTSGVLEWLFDQEKD